MSKSTLSAAFFRVVKSLCVLANTVISWPNAEQRVRNSTRFQRSAQIKGIVGAVDGTYVPIKAPKHSPEVYINRKHQYAITLQAICDADRKLIDCFAGYPSSVSDIRIFRNSDLYKAVEEDINQFYSPGEFIIGDKAYPLSPWCIPPYIARRALTETQINFNIKHAKTRQVIERTFSLLFGRFRRLKYLDMNCTEFIPNTILACCVLHNLCLEDDEAWKTRLEEEGMPFILENDAAVDDPEPVGGIGNNRSGNALTRDAIAQQLYEFGRNRNTS